MHIFEDRPIDLAQQVHYPMTIVTVSGNWSNKQHVPINVFFLSGKAYMPSNKVFPEKPAMDQNIQVTE